MAAFLPLRRIAAWLAAHLGRHYAAAVETLDRGLVVFAVGCATKALASGLGVGGITHLAWWQTIAAAGIGAVITWVQGTLTTYATGSPALLSVVSPTLRARRDSGHQARHRIPTIDPTRKKAP